MKSIGPGFYHIGFSGAGVSGSINRVASLTFAAVLLTISLFGSVQAADGSQLSKQKPAVNAVTGSAWQAEVTPAEPSGGNDVSLPQDQLALLTKINAYMQKFNDVEGRFRQTNPDNAVQKGKFYVLRPGRMRFDYSLPSKMQIVSDGEYLSIEDHDLNTVNKYPLEQTPFRMLLTANVDLQRDARILSLSSSDTTASIKLSDRSGQSAGQIHLFFSMPNMALKEWVITDAQGLHTRIEISNLRFEKKLAVALFTPSKVGLNNAFGDR